MIRCCIFLPLISSDAQLPPPGVTPARSMSEIQMDSIQSLIRTKVKSDEFPGPKGAEAFSAYAIASSKGLIPEMKNAACQTLDHPDVI
jgi:hypothetical protein